MKFFILTVVIASLLPINGLYAQNKAQKVSLKELLGCWRVKDYLHDDESIYTPEKLRAFSKLFICFNHDTAKLLIDTLTHTKYSIKKASTKKYLWDNFQLDKKYFQVTCDTLAILKINGMHFSKNGRSFPMDYDFFYDGNYLFLFIDQTTFRLCKY